MAMTAKKTTKSESARSEIRITVSDQAREISIETNVERDDVRTLVEAALKNSTPLLLTDTRGRQFIIPAAKISSVEIGDISERRVGFAGI